MSSSREESPDWIRDFQVPTQSILALSSGSESLPDDSHASDKGEAVLSEKILQEETSQYSEENEDILNGESPTRNEFKGTSSNKKRNTKATTAKRKRKDDIDKNEGDRSVKKLTKQKAHKKPTKSQEPKHSVWVLSSDSDGHSDSSPIGEAHEDDEISLHETSSPSTKKKVENGALVDVDGISAPNPASKEKSPKKRLKTEEVLSKKNKIGSQTKERGDDGDMKCAEEEIGEKHIGQYVSSSVLPLVLSDKVQRSKALVECEGDSIDLSGDVGAVGRVIIADNLSKNREMFLDLKGTMYRTTIVPSRTFCVVSFGQSEAKRQRVRLVEKIEAIMNDFIQLTPQSNVYEAETMVEGTLDGFSFDSEDEAEKMPRPTANQTDKNEGAEEHSKSKTRGKADKPSGAVRRQGKAAGGKPPKKVKKKQQVPKKTKTKK